MDKKQWFERVAQKTGISKKVVKEVLESGILEIKDEVARGNKAKIANFGIFEPIEKSEKVGTNPVTHERIIIPRKLKPRFRPSENFEKQVDPQRFGA